MIGGLSIKALSNQAKSIARVLDRMRVVDEKRPLEFLSCNLNPYPHCFTLRSFLKGLREKRRKAAGLPRRKWLSCQKTNFSLVGSFILRGIVSYQLFIAF